MVVSKCEHNKVRTRCKECGGGSICEHSKRRSQCKECGGREICEHNKRKSLCKECKGSQICEHNNIKSRCKECGGGSICEHKKRKDHCKDCRGCEICEHNKRRSCCKDCGGSQICKSKTTIGCRTTGNRKLNGYCSHCFVNIFPEDPRALTVRKKSKELKVMTHIFSKYSGFKNDKPFYVDLEGGCCETKRRVDLRKLIDNTMLCIEVDENQHKYYIKQNEIARYNDLFMAFSGKYIFIRYNPDKFTDKYGKSKNPMFDTRMEVLETTINKHIMRILNEENTNLVEIHHLFYDENWWRKVDDIQHSYIIYLYEINPPTKLQSSAHKRFFKKKWRTHRKVLKKNRERFVCIHRAWENAPATYCTCHLVS